MKQWYKIEAKSNQTAQILIYEEIGENWFGEGVSAKRFVEDLNALEDIATIELRINSPGGNVFDGNAIYNALRSHAATINVFIDGIAASIASVVAMSGDTVQMPENSMLMIHDPSGFVMGTAKDMTKTAEALEKIKGGIVAAYHNKSQLDNDQISDMMEEETWLTAKEAVGYGFADNIVDKVQFQARIPSHFFNVFKNMPGYIKNAGKSGIEDKIKEVNSMTTNKIKPTEITVELLKNEHPDIVSALIAEAKTEAMAQGAKSELARIKAVHAQTLPGHEKLIDTLMWDGETTGEQAAVKVLAAENALRAKTIQDHVEDAPDPAIQVDSSPNDDSVRKEQTKTFEEHVSDYIQTNNCSKAKAIKAVARKYPEKHEDYLARINK